MPSAVAANGGLVFLLKFKEGVPPASVAEWWWVLLTRGSESASRQQPETSTKEKQT